MKLTSDEISIICAIIGSVIVAAITVYFTNKNFRTQLKFSSSESAKERDHRMQLEWEISLLNQRFSVADDYVQYLQKQVKRAISMGEARLNGDMSPLHTDSLRDVLANTRIARCRITMQVEVIVAGEIFLHALENVADIIDVAPSLTQEERKKQLQSGVASLAGAWSNVVDLIGDELRGKRWFEDHIDHDEQQRRRTTSDGVTSGKVQARG